MNTEIRKSLLNIHSIRRLFRG